MCGIIACLMRTHPVDIQCLNKAVDSLDHRGPDSKSTWLGNNNKVALGHTRLSIVDIENGNQPFSSTDGTIHAITNGEMYDHHTIRKNLQNKYPRSVLIKFYDLKQ